MGDDKAASIIYSSADKFQSLDSVDQKMVQMSYLESKNKDFFFTALIGLTTAQNNGKV